MALFHPATREKSKLRMAIDGVSGSGKTFTALRFATVLGNRIAIVQSESGSVEKYLGLAPDGIPFAFDVCTLGDYSPTKYTEAILAAGREGYDVIVIDSLTHAWAGAGGALELKDRRASQSGNSFTAWKDITPMHNQMIEAFSHSPCHTIGTMRSKTEYALETDSRGKSVPRKIGTAPVQRAGMEYEFDMYCSMDDEHVMRVTKSRCPDVASGDCIVKPGAEFMAPIITWLNDGSDAPAERFAVTEKDLERFAHRIAAEAPKQPAKSAQEIMAEAKAKADAKADAEAAAATTPAETKPAAQATAASNDIPSGGSSVLQHQEINRMYANLGITDETKAAILAKRGASELKSLSADQAKEIITNLQNAIDKQLADAADATDAAEGSGDSAAADQVTQGGQPAQGKTRIGENEPCTDAQVTDIKNALTEWETTQPGVSADFVARLNGAGFAKIAELTYGQATKLLIDVEAKQIESFFGSQLETAAAG